MTNEFDFTESELKAIRSEYAKGSTDEQFTLFISECKRRKLLPGRQIYFQLRNAREYTPETSGYGFVKRATHLTSIDAFRLIAQRTGEYQGQKPALYIYLDDESQPTVASAIPLPDPDNTAYPKIPWAVQASVFRKGFVEPLTATARFEAYAVYYKKDNKFNLNEMWERRGPEQLAKCAEALALRIAFPEELGGLYIAEEFRDETETPAVASGNIVVVNGATSNLTAPVSVPLTTSTPTIDHKPAEATEAPRPGEKRSRKRTNSEPPAVVPPVRQAPSEPTSDQAQTSQPAHPGRMELSPAGTSPAAVSEPSAVADGSAKQLPTKEELQAFATKVRAFKVDTASIKTWLLKKTGAADAKSITKPQWEQAIKELEDADFAGPDQLKALVAA